MATFGTKPTRRIGRSRKVRRNLNSLRRKMSAILISYLRNNKGIPKGVLVAIKRENGTIGINYSMCRKCDNFNKEMGIKIATGRALSSVDDRPELVPHEIFKKLESFRERVKKYFRVKGKFIDSNNPRFESYHKMVGRSK
jgi:hypothetical protein